VLEIRGVLEQRHDFLARQDLRKLLWLARPRNPELQLGTPERNVVKKPQSLRHDVAARPGELALLDQVHKVVLNFLLADAIRRSRVVLRQPCHRTEIRLARAHGVPVLAFGSHMDLEAREKALSAGALRVVANSKFTSDMPGLVQRMLSESSVTPSDEEGTGE